MKVVCIDKIGDTWTTKDLSIGKIYEVIGEAKSNDDIIYYEIKQKYGSICWILSTNFITIQEYREEKLNQLEI